MKWSSYPPFPSASFLPRKAVLSSVGLLALSGVGFAHEPEPLPTAVVTGRADSLLRIADTASEGFIGRDHLDRRPLLRPGEILETVPGLLVTQHSGAGKANQFFLRGFNLDHGTDFATSLGGVPLNLPSHAHGQGYTDLNFLIPELVGTVHFRKGPSAAEVGDFGSAGAADLGYLRRLERGFATVGGGSFGYARLVAADSRKVGEGDLLYAVEGMHEDGPWTVPSDYRKVNAVVGYDRGTNERGWNVTAMAYAGEWTATDQIPSRAGIGIFDSIDPTDGGDSRRFSLQGDWHGESDRHPPICSPTRWATNWISTRTSPTGWRARTATSSNSATDAPSSGPRPRTRGSTDWANGIPRPPSACRCAATSSRTASSRPLDANG